MVSIVTKLKDNTMISHFMDVIGNKISKSNDFYEKGMLDYIKALGKFTLIVDVGANIGNHTVYFAKYCTDKVIAYEPVLKNFQELTKNMQLNNIVNAEIHNVGLGVNEGSYSSKDIHRNMGACNLKQDDNGTLTVIRPKIEATVGLIKIDCEDMSLEVLESFKDIIKRDSPHIFIEAEPNKIEGIAKSIGYVVVRKFNATPTYHIKRK